MRLVVHAPDGPSHTFSLGAHAPELTSEDVVRIHRLWLGAVEVLGPGVHHRDIVRAALESFEAELAGREHERALGRLRSQVDRP
jgi:hypothetical protein